VAPYPFWLDSGLDTLIFHGHNRASMTASMVTYSHVISCTKCGFMFHGYLEVEPDGTGKTLCPQCGSGIVQALPSDFVPQIPPEDYQDPAHPHVHHTHYPGLYSQPKRHPRVDLVDLVKVLYSPSKAFQNLFLSTDLRMSMAIVLVFSMISVGASMLVSVDMADMTGYDASDAIQLGAEGFMTWALLLLAFLMFGIISAGLSKGVFEGRGQRSATITLVGYCFPAYVLVNVVVLLILKVSFSDLGVALKDLTLSDLNDVSLGLAALIVVALVGLAWLLVITSRAISVANDTSMGEAGLTAVLSVAAAGLMIFVVSLVVNLPLGLSF
jgi:hypothetical protein